MKRRITKHSIGLTQNNKKIKKEEADAFNHSLQKAKSAEKNTKFEFWQQGLYFDNLNTNYIQNTDYKYWMISNKTPMFLVGLPQTGEYNFQIHVTSSLQTLILIL